MLDFVAHPLVEPSWLAAHLHDGDVRVVDARWRGDGTSRELHRQGHLPGAVHLDWQRDLSWTDERGVGYLLLPPEAFAAVMEAVGIHDRTRVVAYAETDHSGAARLWWALCYYGHDQVDVLNGGWTRWVAEGWPIETEIPYPAPATFTTRPRLHLLAIAREIEQALTGADASVRLVDTRPTEQYAGQAIWTPYGSLFLPSGQSWIALADGRVMRGGHIPGAVHLHTSRLLHPVDWTYLPRESLLAVARGADLEPQQRIITGRAGRASRPRWGSLRSTWPATGTSPSTTPPGRNGARSRPCPSNGGRCRRATVKAKREDWRYRMKEQARARARQLAQEFARGGDATGWFEQLYTQAQGNEQAIHWADMEVNPDLVGWLDRRNMQGKGKRALVVGCGLGDDAEELAHRGFEVVAFDIAPTAIAWCRQRFPQSPVEYVVADVFDPPSNWQRSFDFVLEAYTLQVLPADARSRAMTSIAGLLAQGGTLLVICRGRLPEEPPGNLPWPLSTEELEVFKGAGLRQVHFEDYYDQEEPKVRRFRVEYQRASSAES